MKRHERTYETCPYNNLTKDKFFKTANGDRVSNDLSLTINTTTKVSSFGSCFAQKIAGNLKARGINYLDYEKPPLGFTGNPKTLGYEMFSARTGNIYTTPQWLQLIRRALGVEEVDNIYKTSLGEYILMTRPFIGSFKTKKEAEHEEFNHLAAIRRVIADSQVMVFTLGLNEVWYDRPRGIYLPVAPGCGWGQFKSARHVFKVVDSAEADTNIREAEFLIREINPDIHMIYTISPVPLIATFQNMPILQATVLSKAVLRTAIHDFFSAEKIYSARRHYFPSYEIITNPFEIINNFMADMRTISADGERRVMDEFFKAVQSPRGVLTQNETQQVTAVLLQPGPTEIAPPPVLKSVDPCDEEEYWNAVLSVNRADK